MMDRENFWHVTTRKTPQAIFKKSEQPFQMRCANEKNEKQPMVTIIVNGPGPFLACDN